MDNFKINLKTAIAVFALFLSFPGFSQKTLPVKNGWAVHHPFVHDVFIENKGQFIEQVQKGVGAQILYYTHKGHIHIYFSPSSLTFEYDSAYRANDDTSADEEDMTKILPVFTKINWDGANSNPDVEVQSPVSEYFTYENPNDKTGHSGILAHAWKKIIYHNLYNNIDVAFYYPNGNNGLEYDIIVHPGGDLSQVKMHYSDNASISLISNVIHISSPCATFTDRSPLAKDEDGNPVSTSFMLNKNIVSFTAGNYDKSKTLTIDPLLSTTSFTGTNKAYDLQYDLAGNVYVMGGGDKTEYQLQKYNAAGALQWTYTATFTYTFKNYYYYGGFTTDNRSGSSFLAEGLDYSGTGCLVVKLNAAGGVVTTFPGSTNINEIWRLAYDYCDNQLIIGAGEGSSAVYQGATMDTNCAAVNAVNVLNAGAGSTHHDIAMITFDGVGKCYFATTKPADATYKGFENVLLQMPSATLTPTAYLVGDAMTFIETASIPYYPALPSSPYLYCGNGFNGLIADLNLVATYDGNKLRTRTPATGAAVDSVVVTPNTQLWGGIALDCDDNLYVGNDYQVSVYSKTLAPVSTLTLTSSAATDTIYDLHIAPNNILYACGNDFVSGTPVTIPKMVTTTSTSPTGCNCTGTASATVCDNYPYTYSWSNGATTSSISGLCPGKYLLTVKDASCNPRQDTSYVTITGSSGLTATITGTNEKCFGDMNGTASVTATGTGPFTYSWTGGQTTSSVTGLAAGSYTCVVKNTTGCIDTEKITVTQPTALSLLTATTNATCSYLCNGQATVTPNTNAGTPPYNWSWSNGATANTITNMCVNSTYTCTVTDANGCIIDTTVSITNPPPIVLTFTQSPALCGKSNGSATVSASGGTPGLPPAPAYTYLWNSGATTTALSNIPSGNYCVIVTDKNSCTDTSCVKVGSISGDSIKITATTNELCFGGKTGSATATVTAGTAPYTYSWSPTGGTTLNASGLSPGQYTITLTDSTGCSTTAVATITQPPPVKVTVPPDTICIGRSATLTATGSGGTPGYTYLWNGTTTGATYTVSPTTTTNYNVQATDANGCTGDTTVTVVVRNPLVVVAGPPANMCPGSSVILSATGGGGDGQYTYTWSPATGLNVTTGASVTASPTVSTTYTVVIKDTCGTSTAQDAVPVIVYPAPTVNLVADTLQGCAPLCVDFTSLATVSGAGNSIVKWQWSFGDGGTSDSANPHHCYTKPGIYTVGLSVTTNNGCTGSFVINNYITVFGYPVAYFSISPQPTNIMYPTITFTNQSTDQYGTIINWLWQFGDGSDTSGAVPNPVHTYSDTGQYCVNLQVTDNHGCTADTIECLEIEPFFVIYVPNAFTPQNNNGYNTTFFAKGVGIVDFQMWIFDRWGQQLWHCTSTYQPCDWPGTVQGGSGALCQEDTYVWLIICTDVFHVEHRYIGRVTMIR